MGNPIRHARLSTPAGQQSLSYTRDDSFSLLFSCLFYFFSFLFTFFFCFGKYYSMTDEQRQRSTSRECVLSASRLRATTTSSRPSPTCARCCSFWVSRLASARGIYTPHAAAIWSQPYAWSVTRSAHVRDMVQGSDNMTGVWSVVYLFFCAVQFFFSPVLLTRSFTFYFSHIFALRCRELHTNTITFRRTYRHTCRYSRKCVLAKCLTSNGYMMKIAQYSHCHPQAC